MTFTGTIVMYQFYTSKKWCATVTAGQGKFYAETGWHMGMHEAMTEMVHMLDRDHDIVWENIDEDGNYVEM